MGRLVIHVVGRHSFILILRVQGQTSGLGSRGVNGSDEFLTVEISCHVSIYDIPSVKKVIVYCTLQQSMIQTRYTIYKWHQGQSVQILLQIQYSTARP